MNMFISKHPYILVLVGLVLFSPPFLTDRESTWIIASMFVGSISLFIGFILQIFKIFSAPHESVVVRNMDNASGSLKIDKWISVAGWLIVLGVFIWPLLAFGIGYGGDTVPAIPFYMYILSVPACLIAGYFLQRKHKTASLIAYLLPTVFGASLILIALYS